MKLRQARALSAGADAALWLRLLWPAAARSEAGDPKAEAPPPAQVESHAGCKPGQGRSSRAIPDRRRRLVFDGTPDSSIVTGAVTPDVSRNVPVISLAVGPRHRDECAAGR